AFKHTGRPPMKIPSPCFAGWLLITRTRSSPASSIAKDARHGVLLSLPELSISDDAIVFRENGSDGPPAPCDSVINDQQHDCANQRCKEPGRRFRPIPASRAAEEGRDQRTRDADADGDDEASRVPTRR